MPATQVKSIFSVKEDITVSPMLKCFETLDCTCGNCGFRWQMALTEEETSWKGVVDHMRKKYETTMSMLTELIRYTDQHYQFNPHRDQFLEKVEKLRKRLLDDMEDGKEIKDA